MIQKNEIKYYSSLLKKKFRALEKKFIVEGEKTVWEGLASNFICEVVIVSDEFAEGKKEFIRFAEEKKVRIEKVSAKEIKKLSDTKTPQGIAAVFNKTEPLIFDITKMQEKIIVFLDNISDPGNLGTIIRNFDWFGIANLLLSPDCAEYTNPKVIRASMGSVFHINIYEDTGIIHLNELKQNSYKIVATDTNGENLFEFKAGEKSLIIFSNEAHGPSSGIKNITDFTVTIPRYGKAESLNVASASAVVLSHLTK